MILSILEYLQKKLSRTSPNATANQQESLHNRHSYFALSLTPLFNLHKSNPRVLVLGVAEVLSGFGWEDVVSVLGHRSLMFFYLGKDRIIFAYFFDLGVGAVYEGHFVGG